MQDILFPINPNHNILKVINNNHVVFVARLPSLIQIIFDKFAHCIKYRETRTCLHPDLLVLLTISNLTRLTNSRLIVCCYCYKFPCT